MYRRQMLFTLAMISLCFLLLGTGFFSLYYRYHLNELRDVIQQDLDHINTYAGTVMHSDADIYSNQFEFYLNSVSSISNTSILLCELDGTVIHATGSDLTMAPDGTQTVPPWAVDAALRQQEHTGLTTFNGIFAKSSYVTGASIQMRVEVLSPDGTATPADLPVALLFIATDASYVKDFLLNALQMFFLAAACVLVLSMLVGSLFTQHMVQPLRAMSAAAYRFAHGEIDTRMTDYSERDDEIGDLATAFNAMAEAIALGEKRRSEFVANVSHELKTPMTTIAGFADGILDGTIPPSRERESLEIISSETRRLSRLVRRMLELSRLQSQERVAAQVQFDVGELLLQVLVSLEAKVLEKNLEIEANLPEEGAMVWGDPDAITQVCYNLLDNAIKFSREGGVITLGIRFQAGKAYISIRNQGDTIPPPQLSQIFDRFHKADASRSEKEGVGLGLYIVKTILNTYKENITVKSENGETEFTFTLSEV